MTQQIILTLCIITILAGLSGCMHSGRSMPEKQTANTNVILETDNVIKKRILSHYDNWKGVRHKMGGNSRQGIDCSAYTQRVYQSEFGIKIPRVSSDQKNFGSPVSLKKIKVGDLLFFKTSLLSKHVGIYLGDNTFIHVSSSKGVMRSRIDEGYWKKHLKSARQMPINSISYPRSDQTMGILHGG